MGEEPLIQNYGSAGVQKKKSTLKVTFYKWKVTTASVITLQAIPII